MSYLKFDKNQLVNLEYSLDREFIRANKTGCYASQTIVGTRTRKYHGLLVAPQPQFDSNNHIFLSSLDETLVVQGQHYHLATHQFPSNQGGQVFAPRGHKYLEARQMDPIPALTYRIGDILIRKEMLLAQDEDRLMIRYTVLESGGGAFTMRLLPLLAFRSIHRLSKANLNVNPHIDEVKNGIRCKLYHGYDSLYLQLSSAARFVTAPDWHYNFYYAREAERGYEATEDLYTLGYFEAKLDEGEVVVFSASLQPDAPPNLDKHFSAEIKRRVARTDFENCLKNAAQQFIFHKGQRSYVVAGFPWFGPWGRDTFIALPGLTLSLDDPKTCKLVLDSSLEDLKGPLFPNMGLGPEAVYNSVDAPLWFVWALQQYAHYTVSASKIWKEYGPKLRMILEGFRDGAGYGIKMQDDGLIYAGERGKALTWMDALVDGVPVTGRIGCPVEISALWYNAVQFALEAARLAGDTKWAKQWQDVPALTQASFADKYWAKGMYGYLADVVNADGGGTTDWSLRPNQLIATSLPYRITTDDMASAVIDQVRRELLSPRGLRTLSPNDSRYRGQYAGDQRTRDSAYHMGTVWPWLLGPYAEGVLRLYGQKGAASLRQLVAEFEPHLTEAGIGTVSEIFDADPPHAPRGAISQAWSVAALLRIQHLLRQYPA
jgi:predicted glycogen debranching enzyme